MKQSKDNNECRLHNVKFYNLAPRAVNCMSYNRNTCKLALSRHDSSIEIWDMRNAPFMERTILGTTKLHVEVVCWANDQLLSAGLSGEIVHWNLKTLEPKQTLIVTGNAIWCLDFNKDNSMIAAGTEEGYLNICFIIDEMQYHKILDKQEGRILCCKFDHTGDFLVTGSLDAIRVWNVKNGHAILKMTTGRSEARKETVIWSLDILKDFVIISADSRGHITFWDGKLGAQIESYQALKGDVLCVAVNEKEDTLYCSGIEPIIKKYILTSIKKENRVMEKWVKYSQRSVHYHDVKAIVAASNKLFSGGVDGYLVVSSKTVEKHSPFLKTPCAVITTSRLILLKYMNYLEVWRLGTPSINYEIIDEEDEESRNEKKLSLEKGPEKLLELLSRKGDPITCSTMSPNGLWLIYSTDSQIRLFQFHDVGSKPILRSIKPILKQFSPCLNIIFSFDSKYVFLVKKNNLIDVFELTENQELDHKQTIDVGKTIQDILHLVTISKCGKYLALAGLCNNIVVWSFEKNKKNESGQWKHYINLPKYILPAVAMNIHPETGKLVTIFSDSKLIEYDLDELQFTFSIFINKKVNLFIYNNIIFDPRNEDVIIVHNSTSILCIKKNKCEEVTEQNDAKQTKLDADKESANNFTTNLVKKYKCLAHLAWLENNEMVAVEVNPDTLMEQLPPSFKQKKYGTG